MSKRIILISCVSKKQDCTCKARDLYISPLFKKSWEYAKNFNPDKIYILSAEHHLLDPERTIAPYNRTLNNMPTKERKAWANKVLGEIKKCWA